MTEREKRKMVGRLEFLTLDFRFWIECYHCTEIEDEYLSRQRGDAPGIVN